MERKRVVATKGADPPLKWPGSRSWPRAVVHGCWAGVGLGKGGGRQIWAGAIS